MGNGDNASLHRSAMRRQQQGRDPLQDLLQSLSDSSDDDGDAPRKINGVLLMSKLTRKQSHSQRRQAEAPQPPQLQRGSAIAAASRPPPATPQESASKPLTKLKQSSWRRGHTIPKSSQKRKLPIVPALLMGGADPPARTITAFGRSRTPFASGFGFTAPVPVADEAASAAGSLGATRNVSTAPLNSRPAFRPGGASGTLAFTRPTSPTHLLTHDLRTPLRSVWGAAVDTLASTGAVTTKTVFPGSEEVRCPHRMAGTDCITDPVMFLYCSPLLRTTSAGHRRSPVSRLSKLRYALAVLSPTCCA